MRIVVGIGNPGPEYEGTRHNVGFDTVDLVAQDSSLGELTRQRFSSLTVSGMIGDAKVALLKPQTYVNLSGEAVRASLDWYRLSPDALLVVCDDFNLPLGRIRVRTGGSSGGHKGLQSIAEALDTEAFARLRIGIGQPEPGNAVDFVLSRFQGEEIDLIQSTVQRASAAVRCWATEDIEACMTTFNAA